MTDRYLVRCANSQPAQPMTGIYLGRITDTGMVATWRQERAARYENEFAASDVARRMGRKFTGTTWTVEPVEVVQ
jgi:hypothetical protein